MTSARQKLVMVRRTLGDKQLEAANTGNSLENAGCQREKKRSEKYNIIIRRKVQEKLKHCYNLRLRTQKRKKNEDTCMRGINNVSLEEAGSKVTETGKRIVLNRL